VSDYALPVALLGTLILLIAWREYASGNQRDAKLMAACGAGSMLASVAAWVA